MAGELRHGNPEDVGMSPEQLRKAARVAERFVDEEQSSGLVVLVARRGQIVLHEAFGRLNREPDAPVLPLDAIVPVASISKTIIATAVMCLVEDGSVGLNRPVQEYVPEFVGEGKEQVMVHHLLTHTSGLQEEDIGAHAAKKKIEAAIPLPAENQHPAIAEHLFLGYDTLLWKPPGTEMSYCTWGFYLLDDIVRRVSGRPFPDFAAERIFQPLGMIDTSFGLARAKRARLARRYPENPPAPDTAYAGQMESPAHLDAPWTVYSTALALGVYGQMFLQRGSYGEARVLGPAAVAVMTRNQIPGIPLTFGSETFVEASWGLGWDVHGERRGQREPSLHSPGTVSHTGNGGTYLWVDPDNEIVGVYFSLLRQATPYYRPGWNGDLFVNAVTAAIT